MDELRYESHEGEPNPDDFNSLSEGLLAHHTSQGHPKAWKKFSIFLKDKNNKARAV